MKVLVVGIYTFFCYGDGIIYALDHEGVFYNVNRDINDKLYCLLLVSEHYKK